MYNYTEYTYAIEVNVLKKIALIVNFDKKNALKVATELINMLKDKAELYCLSEDSRHLPDVIGMDESELFSSCPVVAVLGGDGTIIATSKKCAPYKNILVGINIGNLGYLSTMESSNLGEVSEILLSDDIHYDNRYMLCVKVYSDGKETCVHHALNEIVLSRSANSHLIDFTAYNNERTLCGYRADGMIVATPTGSTAYSLSAGGPILSPDTDAMVITPICPHMLKARSIVLPQKNLKISASAVSELSVDGQFICAVGLGDYITVEKSSFIARLACNKDLNFYDILQKKL